VVARDRLEGALNVRTREPRVFGEDEVSLLTAIAGQVGQAVENAKLYAKTSARVSELESLTVQEINHRVKNNLQTVASLLRLQARSLDDDRAERALEESVNRILSIAAVHDVLTTTYEDDVDCGELIARLEATLAQGLNNREVDTSLSRVFISGQRATALALVFCELFANAVEHGEGTIRVALDQEGSSGVLVVEDDGAGVTQDSTQGLGLRIATALVREELRGRIELRKKAVVRFPVAS